MAGRKEEQDRFDGPWRGSVLCRINDDLPHSCIIAATPFFVWQQQAYCEHHTNLVRAIELPLVSLPTGSKSLSCLCITRWRERRVKPYVLHPFDCIYVSIIPSVCCCCWADAGQQGARVLVSERRRTERDSSSVTDDATDVSRKTTLGTQSPLPAVFHMIRLYKM